MRKLTGCFLAFSLLSTSGCSILAEEDIVAYANETYKNVQVEEALQRIITSYPASIDPYELLKASPRDTALIIRKKEEALEYMLTSFRNSEENGMKERVMAILCAEITETEEIIKEYSGTAWYEWYMRQH